jgi:hypothetical protein
MLNPLNLVINRETGTLDAYDRAGSRLFRSFATPEAAESALATLDRSPRTKQMVNKFREYLSNPSPVKVTVFKGVQKISDLPKGTVIPAPAGQGAPYVVGARRGRPPSWLVKMLAEANA